VEENTKINAPEANRMMKRGVAPCQYIEVFMANASACYLVADSTPWRLRSSAMAYVLTVQVCTHTIQLLMQQPEHYQHTLTYECTGSVASLAARPSS
jgi:hypothetical protein